MSLTVGNIISPNLVALQSTVLNQSTQIQNLIDLYSDLNKVSFDQVTKQNVVVSYDLTTQLYRFEIQTPENNVFMYQVWKKDNNIMNSSRKYFNIPLKDWIKNIYGQQINFTPTTLIEINNVFYPTVMVDAKVEQRLVEGINTEYCVFYFDTRQISHSTGITIQNLPQSGSYTNVRFDIDDSMGGIEYSGFDYPNNNLSGQSFFIGDNHINVTIGSDRKMYIDADVLSYTNNGSNVTMRFSTEHGYTNYITF